MLEIGGDAGATAAHLKRKGYFHRTGVVDLIHQDLEITGNDFHYSGNLEDAATLDTVLEAEGQFDVILCLDASEHVVIPWATVE